jgi:DNA polymerase elongation subunit (family B)
MSGADFLFRVIDWYACDLLCDDDDESGSNDDQSGPKAPQYVIKMFGMKEDGSTVSLNVTGFRPSFYVKLPRVINKLELDSIYGALGRYHYVIEDIRMVKRKDMWGFNNNEVFPFLRFTFYSHMGMRNVERLFANQQVKFPGMSRYQWKLYESNIEPFIRFIHKQNIQPCGWVRVTQGKYYVDGSTLPSTSKISITARWKYVAGEAKDVMPPFEIASFDIECTSSHGDFPVAKKDYTKPARELVEWFRHLAKTPGTTPSKMRTEVHRALCCMFTEEPYQLSRVYTKKPVDMNDIEQKVATYTHEMIETMKGNIRYYSDMSQEELQREGEEATASDNEDVFEKMMRAQAADDSDDEDSPTTVTKDKVVLAITELMDKHFPKLHGDSIIQIGTVFYKFGEPIMDKFIVTLGSCAPIQDAHVIECTTEKELLLKWTRLMMRKDPDIITGYNIFGFDMSYMVERAKELGCFDEFMMLSRFKEIPAKYEEKNLSSSALGDNILKMITMNGRVLIDVMKVIRRDHSLDTYKLDHVANHFMKGKVKAVDGRTIKVDSMSGIQIGNYLKLGNGVKYQVDTVDYEAKRVTLNEAPPADLPSDQMTWGLSKDDITPKQIFECQTGSDEDRALIGKYCLQDCALCIHLIMKLQMVANNFGMANVCWVPLSYIFQRGQGIKVFSLVSKQSLEDGFVIPVVRKPKTETEEDDEDSYEGAIVLDPEPGIYVDDPISVLDYASLYPSSMISENISHDSIVRDAKYDNLPGFTYVDITYDIFEGKADKKRKVGEQTCRYAQFPDSQKGIIPRILQTLLVQRKLTRKKMEEVVLILMDGSKVQGLIKEDSADAYLIQAATGPQQVLKANVVSKTEAYDDFQKAVLDGLQIAYKVTANSVYGQMGAKTSPLYMKELAASTTATGRKMIMLAKNFLETNFQARVVYGDSVAADTPTTLRINGNVRVHAMEDIAGMYGNGRWVPCVEEGRQTKEACELTGVEVWSDKGWTRVHRIIRHTLASHKKMCRVVSDAGVVDVTDDHSLLLNNGTPLSVNDMKSHQEYPLMICALPRVKEWDNHNKKYLKDTFDNYKCTDAVEAQKMCLFIRSFRTWAKIVAHEDGTYTVQAVPYKPDDTVTKVLEFNDYDGFVYDLTTDNHHFQAGVGQLIVHNTDSIFAIFPNQELRVNNHTGEMEMVKIKGKEAVATSIKLACEASDALKASGLLKKPHDLEYEKTFYPFIILSKKRYVGNLYEFDANKYKQKSMGIALKRRDNANIVKQVYGGILNIILDENNVQKSIDFLNTSLQQLISGQYPLDQLVITKTLKGSYKNPQQIAHKVLADRMKERDPGSAPQVNDRIPFVYIREDQVKHVAKGHKMLQGDRIETPTYIIDNNLTADYKFYITNQIMKPVVQLYALTLNRLKGYNKPMAYWENIEAQLAREGKLTHKKIRDKIGSLREKEAKALLFEPVLQRLENKNKNQTELTSFFRKTEVQTPAAVPQMTMAVAKTKMPRKEAKKTSAVMTMRDYFK